MGYSATGVIKKIGATQTVGQNNTEKREFVISVQDGNFSNELAFQLMKDKVNLISSFKEGQTVNVHFNLKSNESAGRYFTNATAYKIESA